MMSVLQNAFANSSSSLIQSKITGNLVFILLPPLSHWEIISAYVLASVVRGLVVGAGVFVITAWFAHLSSSRRCGSWCSRCWAPPSSAPWA
jgi:ABC-2 type transport system permease protein